MINRVHQITLEKEIIDQKAIYLLLYEEGYHERLSIVTFSKHLFSNGYVLMHDTRKGETSERGGFVVLTGDSLCNHTYKYPTDTNPQRFSNRKRCIYRD